MKNSIIMSVLFLLISCSNSENKVMEITSLRVLKQLSPDTDFSKNLFVLIIPFDGCSSCFNDAISLIPELEKKPNLIIMPNINKKVITNTLENLDIERSTILMDTLQLTLIEKLVQSDPKIFFINRHKISFSSIVDNTTIQEIKEIIKRN